MPFILQITSSQCFRLKIVHILKRHICCSNSIYCVSNSRQRQGQKYYCEVSDIEQRKLRKLRRKMSRFYVYVCALPIRESVPYDPSSVRITNGGVSSSIPFRVLSFHLPAWENLCFSCGYSLHESPTT